MEQYQFEDEVEIIPLENGLLVMPLKVKPREQWDEQFKKAKKEGHVPDKALLEGLRILLIKKNGHSDKSF